ncbi:MAG TPA: segregation/condensation protein A [Candidatus Norongarragalinales archaeon]|jgi:segregation and condensation protein A|nr:segregation/condensation protein A [Candidatus Norongarragalinales archaeon]
MDLLSFVVQPTWREFLHELVETKQMNPWDLDLCEIADAYLEKVRGLQALDLRIPANVILASAILLRFKAEAFTFEDPEPESDVIAAPVFYDTEQIPELMYRTNRPRERKVTLQELVQAVDSVLKDGVRQPIVLKAPKSLNITLPKETMEERIRDTWNRVLSLKDAEGLVMFNEVVRGAQALEGEDELDIFLKHLLPVLHLMNNQKLDAWQDQTFGEIFIKVTLEQQNVQDAVQETQQTQTVIKNA